MFAYSHSANLPTLELSYSDASTASVTASFASWYRSDGLPGVGDNWIAGVCGSSDICLGDNLSYRSAFVFSIPDASILVTGAYIQSFVEDNPLPGYISTNPTGIYTLYEVSTDPSDLTNFVAGVGIYNDLGTGTAFGSQVFSAADNGTFVQINLNAAGLASINAASDLNWAVGGDFPSASNPVPEPGTWAMIAAGLGAASLLRRRS
jgi:hypothetical protein